MAKKERSGLGAVNLQIESIAIKELKEYARNVKLHPREQIEEIKASIQEYGFDDPIAIDENNVIIEGHGRVMAVRELGYEEVPCIRLSHLTEVQKEKYRIAHNKLTMNSGMDVEMLSEIIHELQESGESLSGLGFTEDELDLLIDEAIESIEYDTGGLKRKEGVEPEEEIEIEEDEVPEVDEEAEPITKLGDIWELGNHRLMCGDSTKQEDVERLMDGVKADMCVTDPPYNVAYEGGTEDALTIQNDDMSSDEFLEFLTSAFERVVDVLKEGGAFYVWFASREHVNFETALNQAGLVVRQELIWVKSSLVLGRQDYQWKHEPCLYGWKDGASHNWYSDRSQTTVLEFDKPSRNGEHPTMKPVELIAYQIRNSSKKDNVVLDLFGGSGTTLIACEQLNRRCRMMELDPKYCDVIIKRWETLTGRKAVKV